MNRTPHDIMLDRFIDDYFYNSWKPTNTDHHFNRVLELYVTADCNLACEYCYINKHGSKLYPKDIRNKSTILKNLRMLLDYYVANKFYIKVIDIFSGEIFCSKFGYDVLDVLFEYGSKYGLFTYVTVPTNCTFVAYPRYFNMMKKMIKKYRDAGLDIEISASVDGKILDQSTRSFRLEMENQLRNDKYYDRLFRFLADNKYGCHPMVSAHNVDMWIDNYEWYKTMYNKIGYDIRELMMLEVRNDNWTQDKIASYLKFLDYVIDDHRDTFYKNNFRGYIGEVLGFIPNSEYDNTALNQQVSGLTCALQDTLVVRLGDLSIVPCHRTSYDKFVIGHYEIKDDEIVGLKSDNLLFGLKTYSLDPSKSNVHCEHCFIKDYCVRGCLGSQYESTGDPFHPIDSVCDLYVSKIVHLCKRFDSEGVTDYVSSHPEEFPKRLQDTVEFIKNVVGGKYDDQYSE